MYMDGAAAVVVVTLLMLLLTNEWVSADVPRMEF